MQQREKLFRKVALERLSTPERLDELVQVTTPKGWLALLALCGVIAATVIWGVYGSVPTIVNGQGILIRDGSVQVVESPASGQVLDLFVGVGAEVHRDQVVARIFQEGDASREGGGTSRAIFVTSQYTGRVLEVRVIRGNVVQPGTGLVSLTVPGRSLEAVLYLAPGDAKQVHPGMTVQVAPSTVKREEFGMMLGRVTDVGELPASQASMKRVLGSDELVKFLTQNGAPIEVHVEPVRSLKTPSGYQWTSTTGSTFEGLSAFATPWLSTWAPPWVSTWFSGFNAASGPLISIESGTVCQAVVVVDEQAPIYLVLAKFNPRTK